MAIRYATESKQSDGPSIATRRRGDALEDAILDAAWEVLREHGYAGFTYEAIAARAETSRPVLYRRWPQREDMLLAVLARLRASKPIAVPDTGSLRDDAIGLLNRANAARARAMTRIGVQLLEYFRAAETSLDELRAALGAGKEPGACETIVARAVARGEIPDVVRPERVVRLPLDLLRYEILTTMRPTPEATLASIVDDVWIPLLTNPRPDRGAAAPACKGTRRGSRP